jgi:sodium-dependent dicarboxylate transporter 2/3/5
VNNDIIRPLIFWAQQKRWLLFAFLLGTLMYWLPYPESISISGYRTLILAIIAIILIITEPIPLPATALLIAVLEVSFHIAPAAEVAQSYMNDSVFFIMGSLMMAVAIVHQGLDTRLALGIIKFTGNKVSNIVFGFSLISAVLSSFIGEHTVVALMLPVGLSLVRNSKGHRDITNLTVLILFSIAYGSTVGSVGTPSGGARNAILIEYLKNLPNPIFLSYSEWILMAYPMVLIGMFTTSIMLKMAFKPEYVHLDTAIRKLKIQVAHRGKITGKELLTIIIFGIVFMGWILLNEEFGMGIIALAGAFLYMATGLVEWKDISKNTNWGVILLFSGVISLGIQMKNTGAAQWIGNSIIGYSGDAISSLTFLPYFINILLTTTLSNIMSSSGTVAVIGPITLNMGGDPLFMGMTTAISSAFGYFSAVAAPACMIIYSSGLVKVSDFLRAGWRMGIMSILTLLLIQAFYWPFIVKFFNIQ